MPDGGDVPTELELKNLAIDLKKATDEVKSYAELVQKEMKNLGGATDETKASADKALAEMNTLSQRLTEVEQKMARRSGGDAPTSMKSIGQYVVENDGVKAMLDRKNGAKLRVVLIATSSL